jgi:glycosyltransferase involved in cell wall biosynthesis
MLRKIVTLFQLPPNTSWTHFGKGEQKSKLLKRFNGDSRKFGFSVIENAPDAIVQTALASSTLFVQPSRYEGSSLTTLEAMTQSCLIVATPVGGIPDKIRHHQNGFLASEVTAQALADCIATAMESDSQELRDAARLHVLTHFSSVSTSQQYFELFQSRTASAV